MKKQNLYYKLLFCICAIMLNGCKDKTQTPSDMGGHFEYSGYNPELIKAFKIKSRTTIEIASGLTPIYLDYPPDKVKSIDYFNEQGYFTLSIVPKYQKDNCDTTNYWKLPSFEQSLLAIRDRTFETNKPTGEVDSIFFYYNDKNLLIKEEVISQNSFLNKTYVESVTTYEYDEKGNGIKFCMSSDRRSTWCSIREYTYDKKDRILTEINKYPDLQFNDDDEGGTKEVETKKEYKYSYYPNGYLKSKGNDSSIYDKKFYFIKINNMTI